MDDLPIEVLLEKEKVLDSEINEESDKVKLQSDLVSTIKKMDSHGLDDDPFHLENNMDNFYMADEGVEQDAMDFMQDFSYNRNEEDP